MADLVDLPSWRLNTADLIQQTAAFLWLHKGDEHKDLYKTVTGARITYELYQRLSSTRDIETFQTQCIMALVDYIKSHPKASEAELTKEVEQQVILFKQRIQSL
jgi:hypothetical protein